MGRHFKILTKLLALVNDLRETANSCLHELNVHTRKFILDFGIQLRINKELKLRRK